MSTPTEWMRRVMLIRNIEYEVSDDSVSETLLDNLESIEKLKEEEEVPNTMKSAYYAVALECIIKYLAHKEELKAAITSPIIRRSLLALNTRNAALGSVSNYLRDAWTSIQVSRAVAGARVHTLGVDSGAGPHTHGLGSGSVGGNSDSQFAAKEEEQEPIAVAVHVPDDANPPAHSYE
ncbi:hypothetical protein TorRG33x02_109620, partial [Trema orientale]